MDLSIITVNYNTSRLLANCISSIYETVKGISFEVIVVDNGSTDDSIKIIEEEFPDVRIIDKKKNLGFSIAANIAIDNAGGKFILIIHPDIKFLPGSISRLLNFLNEHPEVGIVGGNLIYPDGSINSCPLYRRSIRRELIEFGFPIKDLDEKISEFLNVAIKKNISLYWDHKTLVESASIWNACMMFRKEVIVDIGGFSEDFFVWFADTDWCYRAKDVGWKLFLIPEAMMVHFEQMSKDYLDENDTVEYKINSLIVAEAMNKDLVTLLNRHYSNLYILLSKIVHELAISKAKIHKTLRR